MAIGAARSEVESTLQELFKLPGREKLIPFIEQWFIDATGIMSSALTREISQQITSGKKASELTDINIAYTPEEITKLETLMGALLTTFPEAFIVLEPFVTRLREQKEQIEKETATVPVEEEGKYHQPRNDFERVLYDSGFKEHLRQPPVFLESEMVGKTETEIAEAKRVFAEEKKKFLEKKYKDYFKCFTSLVVSTTWNDIIFFDSGLVVPELKQRTMAVRGVQQPKTVAAILETMMSFEDGNTDDLEQLVAKTQMEQMGDALGSFDFFAGLTKRLLGENKDLSPDDIQAFYSPGTTDRMAACFDPFVWANMGRFDFPLAFRGPDGKWLSEEQVDEPLRERLLDALQEILSRRVYGEVRDEERTYVQNLYNLPYTKARSGEKKGNDVVFSVDETVLPAFHFDQYGRRTIPRLLKLKTLPSGRDGAMLPRVRVVKGATNQQEAVRREIVYKLLPDQLKRSLGENWQQDEEISNFIQRSEGTKSYQQANLAVLWAEMICEISGESAFEDARGPDPEHISSKKGHGHNALTALERIYNPTLAALRYLRGQKEGETEGGEQVGEINPFLVGWQSFLLTWFDYWLVEHEDRVGTMAQHILWADKWEDVPWGKVSSKSTQYWNGHIQQMMVIVKTAFDGFKAGDLRNLAQVDVKTNEISKVNTAIVKEFIRLNRQIGGYMLEAFSKPDQVFPEGKGDLETKALQTSQFIKIRVQDYHGKKDPEELVTRAHQFLMFDELDIYDWVPRKLKNPKNPKLGAAWVTEDLKDKDGNVVLDQSGEPFKHKVLVIVVDGNKLSEHESMPKPQELLHQEAWTRVILAGSGRGDAIKNLQKQDIAVLGILLSSELRELYRLRYFGSVSKHAFTKMVDGFSNTRLGERWLSPDLLRNELPNVIGPNVFTKEAFFKMLTKIGYKVTIEELLDVGKTFIEAMSGTPAKK
jgi:hypothetical protein